MKKLPDLKPRPYITAILAMSADGKIADASRSAARFPSPADQAHLQAQIAKSDATLFGAGTLRAYGTTMSVTDPALLAVRRSPDQPIQIVCTATGNLDPNCRFFSQPVPRWLITTAEGIQYWRARLAQKRPSVQNLDPQQLPQPPLQPPLQPPRQRPHQRPFDHTLITERPFNWHNLMQELRTGQSSLSDSTSRRPIQRLLVMGGSELVASLLTDGFIDELYLTVCPLLIGGKTAPTPVGGLGFTLPRTPRLKLLSATVEGDEVFLHYQVLAL
ncbi:MAG: 5-amino-6-(5-phosphoribosylamino)uracil reductase RibD2 [Phormidesmis priestleyi Ana]|uniref:5-amino-6-(5-phosphoribosylamino)uracil reductase RibD2 n=1 Tax=Phormidesmis priestleyi Ana TaxID=1666911 RepID=A0A0N8KNP3_9CYAN|nr:MAG: 5-amino-6-(5-phosphoribosylamino)uracil reductase RibD2 [Phormidesmis priestleyi Ana]